MADPDPELSVMLSNGPQTETFRIATLGPRQAGWLVAEPGAPVCVVRHVAAALESRQRLDAQMAGRLAAGWAPVDGSLGRACPSRMPLPPDLVLALTSLLDALERNGSTLQIADPSGQLWAAYERLRQQVRQRLHRFTTGKCNERGKFLCDVDGIPANTA